MEACPNPYTRDALTGVPALTLHNPWGLAIARYGKDVENRGWAPPPGVTRLFIHAGKDFDSTGLALLRRYGHDDALAHVVPSAIVAVADLEQVCRVALNSRRRCSCGRWAFAGQAHWRLTNVHALPSPVPCRGRQRLWHPAGAILDAVAESLARLALIPLTCNGRRLDDKGRPVGDRHGAQLDPRSGETADELDRRARVVGWKVGPRPEAGAPPDAMCPRCGRGSNE